MLKNRLRWNDHPGGTRIAEDRPAMARAFAYLFGSGATLAFVTIPLDQRARPLPSGGHRAGDSGLPGGGPDALALRSPAAARLRGIPCRRDSAGEPGGPLRGSPGPHRLLDVLLLGGPRRLLFLRAKPRDSAPAARRAVLHDRARAQHCDRQGAAVADDDRHTDGGGRHGPAAERADADAGRRTRRMPPAPIP